MGGSSLGPEVIRRSFGEDADGSRLRVLDSTHPDAVLELQQSVDLASSGTALRTRPTSAGATRVVVPFPIACGRCEACQREQYSVCETFDPNAGMAEKMFGTGRPPSCS